MTSPVGVTHILRNANLESSNSASNIAWQFGLAIYIGSTIRAFKIRISRHMGQPSWIGRPIHIPPHSAVTVACIIINLVI